MSEPIRFEDLSPLDRPDPQDAAIRLMDVLRALNDEAWRLRNLLVGSSAQTAVNRSLAAARAIEIAALASDAVVLAEQTGRSRRAAGAYAHDYREGR